MTPPSGPDEFLDLFDGQDAEDGHTVEGRDSADGPDPARTEELRPWSISELNARARTLLESGFESLWVVGEVTNWTRARSGHCYFTLKDDSAQLRCVMWRRDAARIPVDPEEGSRIRAFGSVTLYEARGDFQLAARELAAEGDEGLWKLAFEKLRRTLEAEGLLDPARRRPIPRFPGSVGVVTSPTGAAIRDVLRVVSRRAPWTRVVVAPARVQGEGASSEVADALDRLSGSGLCDVIIVGRGGGSIEDLWAFNEEPVARAIARSSVPVISAVGHETDTTIADLVADLRAATPSAAAEAAVPDREAVRELLARIEPRLSRGLRAGVDRQANRVRELRLRMVRGLERRVEPGRRTVDRAWERLPNAIRRTLAARRDRQGRLAGRLEGLSPLSTLSRGYAVAQDATGGVLRAVADFQVGQAFRLRVADGEVVAETTELKPGEGVTRPPPANETESTHGDRHE